jgi:hypothetical protein
LLDTLLLLHSRHFKRKRDVPSPLFSEYWHSTLMFWSAYESSKSTIAQANVCLSLCSKTTKSLPCVCLSSCDLSMILVHSAYNSDPGALFCSNTRVFKSKATASCCISLSCQEVEVRELDSLHFPQPQSWVNSANVLHSLLFGVTQILLLYLVSTLLGTFLKQTL